MRATVIAIVMILATACASRPDYPAPPVEGDEIVIDTRALQEHTPVFYSFMMDGKRYDFFVMSHKGEVSSYVDACFECGPKKKGFRKEGRRLRCLNCSESFPLDDLSGIGSCYPIALPGEKRGDVYAIKIEQLTKKTKHPL